MSTTTGRDHAEGWAVPGYVEQRELGHGASGRVVEAVQEQTTLQVAIRYLSPDLVADPDFLTRFRTQMLKLKQPRRSVGRAGLRLRRGPRSGRRSPSSWRSRTSPGSPRSRGSRKRLEEPEEPADSGEQEKPGDPEEPEDAEGLEALEEPEEKSPADSGEQEKPGDAEEPEDAGEPEALEEPEEPD